MPFFSVVPNVPVVAPGFFFFAQERSYYTLYSAYRDDTGSVEGNECVNHFNAIDFSLFLLPVHFSQGKWAGAVTLKDQND